MYPHSLWGRYYEQSVVGLNGTYGTHIPLFHLLHHSIPILLSKVVLPPFTSSGGSYQPEEQLSSTVMEPNPPEVLQQGLYSAAGWEALSWRELVI